MALLQRRRLAHEAGRALLAAAESWGPVGAAAVPAAAAAAAAAAALPAQVCPRAPAARRYAKAAAGDTPAAAGGMRAIVAAYVESAMEKLSIPTRDLAALLARPAASGADVLDWAAARLGAHTARDAAAPHLARVRALRAKLGAASAAWQAPRSPSELLLQRVGARAVVARLEALAGDELAAQPEVAAAATALAKRGRTAAGASDAAAALAALRPVAPQLLDASPMDVLLHPGFWCHAAAAAQHRSQGPALVAELEEEGGAGAWGRRPAAALEAVAGHQGALAAALGGPVVEEAAALAATAPLGAARQADWALAAARAGPMGARRVAALRLAQWAAAQLGLSTAVGCAGAGGDAPAWELVRRISLVVPPPPALPQPLVAALAAAAPALLEALAAQPAEALARGAVDPEQLIGDGAKALASELAAWRAAAAAAGSVPALCGLSRPEVGALPSGAFDAVRARVGGMGVAGRRAMSAALAAAAAGRSPVAFLLSGGAPPDAAPGEQPQGKDPQPAAWQRLEPLAWAVHTGGAAAAARLLAAALGGAAADYGAAAADCARAQRAVDDLRAAFALELEVARRSSVARPDQLFSGETQQQVEELLPEPPMLRPLQREIYSAATGAGGHSGDAGSLLAGIAAVLPSLGGGDAAQALRSWHEVRQQLAAAPRQLPQPLQGLFEDLLADGDDAGAAAADGGGGGAAAAELRVARLRDRLAAFLAAWDAAAAAGGAGGSVTTAPDFTAAADGWAGAAAGPQATPGAVAGLVELVGAEEAAEVLAAAAAGDRERGGQDRRERRGDDEGESAFQPYEVLERVHHDIHVQQYLANEFDPSLALELSAPPVGWSDPRLAPAASDWLEGMRPLLDAHLEAHGEEPLHDIEWKVYKGVALAEAADADAVHEAGLRVRGHSASHDSAADAAALRARLAAGLPPRSVLAPAASKYLEAALANRSWTYAARRRMVDRMLEVARHLADHPPRSHRGSPFSEVLQPDGPPLVPRLSRGAAGRRARRGVAAGVEMLDTGPS